RGWNFGGSVKSPQWFETFRFNSADELGRPRSLRFRFDYPMILSAGIAYTGFERLVIATDLRYLDFKNAAGLGTAAFDRAGAVTGLGWDSVFAVATGVQYQWTDSLSVRVGYSFSQNPIGDAVSFFNIASSSITQHILYAGWSYNVTHAWKVSAAYVHAFKNSITGPFVTPFGALPQTSVTSELSVDSLVAGVSVQF